MQRLGYVVIGVVGRRQRRRCATHRVSPRRWNGRGHDPQERLVPMDERTLAHFMEKVQKQSEVTSPHVDTPCWLWTGGVDKDGYGCWYVGGAARAHRRMFEHAKRPLGRKWCLHVCDTPSCVNPDHLFEGTPKDNTRDMIGKGRNKKGNLHHARRLSRASVVDVRRLYALGKNIYDLGTAFDVDPSTIRRAVTGKTWSHVPGAVSCRTAAESNRQKSRMTPGLVRKVRWLRSAGFTYPEIGYAFDISRHQAGMICRRKIWSHVS
jgi:hypothetical protein